MRFFARIGPRAAAYGVAVVIGLSFSYDLLRMPIQRFDAVQDLLDVQRSPGVYATFAANLGGPGSTGGTALLRPLKFAVIKALFEASDGRYQVAFRGFHAVLLAAGVLLLVGALGVRTWADFAAATFALTVFTGLHTFQGTVREAWPVNHNLEVVVLCLLAVNLVRARSRWLTDLALAVTFVAAALTLESGVLVWVIVAAAWACGARGASTRSLIAVTTLLAAYMVVRFLALSITVPGLDERNSGFLLRMLEGDELAARFGDGPIWFYLYNVAASMLSVLFAEPQSGVFEFVRAWVDGDIPPRSWVAVISSTSTTLLVAWAAWQVLRRERRLGGDAVLWFVMFGAMLAANAALSFAYTKDEIVAPAGALYAGAAFAAARYVLHEERIARRRLGHVALCLVLAITAGLWAFRSAGVHHILRVQAFKHRNDWARLVEDTSPAARRDPSAALVHRLRQDAIAMRGPTPDLLGRWPGRWWGE